MHKKDLTPYEVRRLNAQRTCPICKKRISDYQQFEMIKLRDGREVHYLFAHTDCWIRDPLTTFRMGNLLNE